MYDTCSFRLNTVQTRSAVKALANVKDTPDQWHEGNTRYIGRLNNLWATIDCLGISVRGSICKYFLGNNAEVLSRRDTEQAIESLSDTLGLPMASAMVNRLDIGANLLMKSPLSSYMTLLGEMPYMRKSFYADRQTVQYSNKRRAMLFYDKIADMKRLKEPIPVPIQGKNLLRVELRFLKKSAKQLGEDAIRAVDLYDEIFYVKSIDKFKEQYFLVQKLRKEAAIAMTGQKELLYSLAFRGLQAVGGQDIALGLLKAEKEKGKLTKMQVSRLRAKLKEIATQTMTEDGAYDVLEMDSKIRQAVNYYR